MLLTQYISGINYGRLLNSKHIGHYRIKMNARKIMEEKDFIMKAASIKDPVCLLK